MVNFRKEHELVYYARVKHLFHFKSDGSCIKRDGEEPFKLQLQIKHTRDDQNVLFIVGYIGQMNVLLCYIDDAKLLSVLPDGTSVKSN